FSAINSSGTGLTQIKARSSELTYAAATSEDKSMSNGDRRFMEMAIEQARAQLERYGLEEGGERPSPKVGCVVVTKNGRVEVGYRGELEPGEHAEFTVMEKKLPHEQLAGATVFTTLEPCTDRSPPKISCADRLIERQVGRVVIGILDPDDRGQGYYKLL